MLKSLIKIENINLNVVSKNKDELIEEMSELLCKNGYLKNKEKFKKDIYKREKLSNTAIGFGIAIPHAKSKYVKECCIGIGISKNGVDYDSVDGEKVNIIFIIAIEGKENDLHLRALADISRKLMHEEFRNKLLQATSEKDIYELMCE